MFKSLKNISNCTNKKHYLIYNFLLKPQLFKLY